MNLDQLKYLIEISNSPSINAASEKLHISYQALSHSIKSLENELGLSLLTRTHRGSRLTPDGYHLVNLSKSFIAGVNAMQSKNDPETLQISGDVNILTSSLCLENFLFDLMASNKASYPNLNFNYQVCNSKDALQAMIKQHSDYISICFFGFLDLYDFDYPQDLQVIDLFTSEVRCMCSPLHELAQYQSVSLKQLANYHLLVRNDETAATIRPGIFDQSHIFVEPNPVLFERKITSAGYIALTYKVPFAPYWLPQMNNVLRVGIHTNNPIKLKVMYHKSFDMNLQTKIFLNSLFKMVGCDQAL